MQILIADDEALTRMGLQAMLREMGHTLRCKLRLPQSERSQPLQSYNMPKAAVRHVAV